MKPFVLSLLFLAGFSPAQNTRTFTGTITDSMCALADHSRMRMGATDAECAIACVDAHGSSFVLYDGNDAYILSDQKTAEKFAGRRVAVTGFLKTENKTIQMESITAAK
jgi:hypothetical protein